MEETFEGASDDVCSKDRKRSTYYEKPATIPPHNLGMDLDKVDLDGHMEEIEEDDETVQNFSSQFIASHAKESENVHKETEDARVEPEPPRKSSGNPNRPLTPAEKAAKARKEKEEAEAERKRKVRGPERYESKGSPYTFHTRSVL